MSPTVRKLMMDVPQLQTLAGLPGLELWLSTKDPADILASGGVVRLWRDKSGKSNETVLACGGAGEAPVTNIAAFGSGDFTIAFWINDSLTTDRWVMADAAGNTLVQIWSTGRAQWYAGGGSKVLTAAGTVLPYTDTFITVVRSGGTATIYKNAVSVLSGADATNLTNPITRFSGAAAAMGGTLRYPTIFSRALSAGEIATLYAAGGVVTSISVSGLLCYFDFTTATRGAATVTDTSGNSCVLTTSTGARISGARDLYQGTAASQPAWVSGDAVVYTSDFSAGVDSWVNASGGCTLTGNVDSIGGVDNVMSISTGGSRPSFRRDTPALIPGIRYTIAGNIRLDATMYATGIKGIRFDDSSNNGQAYVVVSAADTWTQFSFDLLLDRTNVLFEFCSSNGGTLNVTTGTFYIYGITITRTGNVPSNNAVFDGTNDYMKTAPFPLVQPEWVVMVGKQVSWTADDTFVSGSANGGMNIGQSPSSPNIVIYAGSAAGQTNQLAVGTTGIITAVFNGASSSLSINRLAPNTGNPGSANAGGITIGSNGGGVSEFANFVFNELAIFSRAPSAADISRVVTYMARKWNIAT